MSSTELQALLQLWHTPGIGSWRLRKLLARFQTATNVLRASLRELAQVDGIDQILAGHIKSNTDTAFVEQQLQRLETHHTQLLTFWDVEYPALLKTVNDPPIFLFVKGTPAALSLKQLAIVGTRNPSLYGRLMAEKFSRELVVKGFCIISGLARGVDTFAHRAALAAGGGTIGVLASGVDIIYPDENAGLAQEMLERGALISEYPMGTKPEASYFPRRNRIIAGLSIGTLVIEAGHTSGALITADNALEYNREVFAVPGNINNTKSIGCNQLIQQGAKLVSNVQDILDELPGFSEGRPQQTLPLLLSDEEERLMTFLSEEPMYIDAIATSSGFSAAQVLSILLQLELRSLVFQLPGKQFVRVP
jgi:DNA processing protein